jgi:hypothetical protein
LYIDINNINEENANILVLLYDMYGKQFYGKTYIDVKNNNPIEVRDLINIPTGVYFVIIVSDGIYYKHKIVIQN